MATRSRTGWKRSEPRSYGPSAPDASVRRALEAIRFARAAAPSYANGVRPCPAVEIDRLGVLLGLKVKVRQLDHPCLLIPPIAGLACLMFDEWVHRGTRDFIARHELGHRAAGDCDEPIFFQFTDALPEAESVADLFAFADLVTSVDCSQGRQWVASKMRRMVTLDYEPWYRRLEPDRLPAQLIRLRQQLND